MVKEINLQMSKGRPARVLGFCCQINTGKVEYLAVHPALCGEMCNENFESSLRLKEDLKESTTAQQSLRAILRTGMRAKQYHEFSHKASGHSVYKRTA